MVAGLLCSEGWQDERECGDTGGDQPAAPTRLWVLAGTTVGLHFPLHKLGESGAGTQGSEGWGRGGTPGAWPPPAGALPQLVGFEGAARGLEPSLG